MCLDNSESNPNFIWGVLYFFPSKGLLPLCGSLNFTTEPFFVRLMEGLSWFIEANNIFVVTGRENQLWFYVLLIGRPIRDKK